MRRISAKNSPEGVLTFGNCIAGVMNIACLYASGMRTHI